MLQATGCQVLQATVNQVHLHECTCTCKDRDPKEKGPLTCVIYQRQTMQTMQTMQWIWRKWKLPQWQGAQCPIRRKKGLSPRCCKQLQAGCTCIQLFGREALADANRWFTYLRIVKANCKIMHIGWSYSYSKPHVYVRLLLFLMLLMSASTAFYSWCNT